MDEVELKFRLTGAEAHDRLRETLLPLGAERRPVEHEENRLYDGASGPLDEAGAVLRLRVVDGGPRAKLTYKGPARYDGAVKARREIEVGVADAEGMHALLEALGYRVTRIYHKERELWRLGDAEVALDTLVFGHFCEIEGPVEAITSLARTLGLDAGQAERRGYPALAAEHEEHERETGAGGL